MTDYLQKARTVLDRINHLAGISEDQNCIARTFGTDAFIRGSQLVAEWMREAGLTVRTDNIGNVRGRLESKIAGAKTFVIGSHIDTVINAGKFDGPLGVLVGLSLLEDLSSRENRLPFNIELIAFSDEEGVRFHTTYLGSKVLAGSFDQSLLEKEDSNGIALHKVLRDMGKNPALLVDDAMPKENLLGYFEVHIEQGPILYERKTPVAIVTAIAGQRRILVTVNGVAGHAGTVPMDMRDDALCCASEIILAIEQFASENKNVLATVGKLDIINAASNVIPGELTFSIDLRSPDDLILSNAYNSLQEICSTICKKRNIRFEWNLVQGTKAVGCSKELNRLLQQAIIQSEHEVVQLVSGAGHDAVPLSEVAPVSMLFVRCYKGISHNPLEDVELADIAAAIQVSEKFIQQLANKSSVLNTNY